MFTAKVAIVALLAVSATATIAAPSRLTDVQFIAANRCLGLMESKSLGTPDADAMKAFVKAQGDARVSDAWDRGDQARTDARSAADHATGYARDRLVSERDGVCHALLPSSQTSAASNGGARAE